MEDVRRRLLSTDLNTGENSPAPHDEEVMLSQVEERYYYIPGELFIINYSDVSKMNITYLQEA